MFRGWGVVKVLHVYRTYFPDPPGGLQEAIRQIGLATAPFGVESRIFTLSPQPSPEEIERPEGRVVRRRSWAAPASCDLGGWGAFATFHQMTSWADVVQYHFPWPFADLLHLSVRRGPPAVMTYHSDIVRQRALSLAYGPLMRHTLRGMAAVVATSPTYAQTSAVLKRWVDPERLRVIPLGISDETSQGVKGRPTAEALGRLGLGAGPFLLALGVLRYYKGFHYLVEAARGIPATVVIAGSGPEGSRLAALARDRGADNVRLLGQVSIEEKHALLARCRALVLPSHLRSEAFGMVMVEAAMFGRPMVCCEVGSGTSFVNLDGETGFVVPPADPVALAEACSRLVRDEPLATRMGAAARRRYETLFSGQALGRAYWELYREVVHGEGR